MSENTDEYVGSVDPAASARRTAGWGPDEHPAPLSPEQAERLQQHEEPVAAANFGNALTGDTGQAEVADESADAPETQRPDTSLGHEGGARYRAAEGG